MAGIPLRATIVFLISVVATKAQDLKGESAATQTNNTDKYDLELCTYFTFYEQCFLGEQTDDYDLTIDEDYVWGLFEPTSKTQVDKIRIFKKLRSYMSNYDLLENLNELNSVPNRAVFCLKCKDITDDALYYYDVADDLVKYFSPVLLTVGTIGNVLSFLMMSRKSMRESVICTQIAIIAITDTLSLWYGIFFFYLEKTFETRLTDLSTASCQIGETIQNWLLIMPCWLITFMSIERFIAVYFPLKSKLYLKRKSIIIASIILAIVSFILSFPSYFSAEIRDHKDHQHCYVKDDRIVFNQNVLKYIPVFLSYIPFCIILLANIGIITKITCSRGDLGQQTANVQTTSMTVSLVVVSFAFIVVTFPITFFNFGETVMYTGDHPEVRGARFYLYNMLAHCMMYSNYGINFYLYISTGPRFRSELALMFKEFLRFVSCRLCYGSDDALDSSTGTQVSTRSATLKKTSENSV